MIFAVNGENAPAGVIDNTTFLDSSTNNFAVTPYGDAAQTNTSPFGGTYGMVWTDSSIAATTRAQVSVAHNTNICFGTGDFTLECWVYASGVTTGINTWLYNKGSNLITVNNGTVKVSLHTGTAYILNAVSFGTIAKGNWYHIAVTRSGNNYYGYLNGVQYSLGTSASSPGDFSASGLLFGVNATSGTSDYGSISNLRFVKGSAVYTSTFTPPTADLTAISGTQLLTCQSYNLIDKSPNNFTLTNDASGYPWIQPVIIYGTSVYSKDLHGGSMHLDGTGDYLTVPTNNNLLIGSQDYTVECWMYLTQSASATQYLFSQRPATGGSTAISLATISSKVKLLTPVVITGTTTLVINKWYHVSVSRSGGTTRLFLNGKLEGSIAETVSYTQGINTIGSDPVATTNEFQGYISNFRFVIGTGLYTSAFTPATAPLTAVSGTQLLLSCTNSAVYDQTRNIPIKTSNTLSTSVKKFGNGGVLGLSATSAKFTKSVITPNQTDLTGDFTVELFAYVTALTPSGGDIQLLTFGAYTSNYGFAINVGYGQNITVVGTLGVHSNNNAISLNTWYHIAVVRNGSVVTLYLDGVAVSTFTQSNKWVYTYAGDFITLYEGYVDEVYIVKNVAKYTTNFTPPTQPLRLS